MRMKYVLWLILCAGLLSSCKKEKTSTVPPSQVLLKDIVIPGLPSPYYHFEYNGAGKVIKTSFLSGINMYDIVYDAGKISEIKNNTAVNKDRLQYTYDENGKPGVIKYANESGVVYRRAYFTYTGNLLTKIEWEKKVVPGFIIDRSITFTYHPDGNLLELTDHRPAMTGQPEATYIDRFEQYDNKTNTDGFSVFHQSNEHLFLLPGVSFQKNNPGKVIRTGTGIHYTIDYTYTYNNRNVPVLKTGHAVFTSGPDTGQQFEVASSFSYY